MRDFKQLKVWQKAHQLVLQIYRHTSSFPDQERFGLTAHLVKSAVSIPSNIAEGCGREGDKELARFLSIAAGSASETEYQLLLARDLAYLSPQSHQELDDQVNEVKRMLNAFIQRLGQSS
jgi:four helix bundle protein